MAGSNGKAVFNRHLDFLRRVQHCLREEANDVLIFRMTTTLLIFKLSWCVFARFNLWRQYCRDHCQVLRVSLEIIGTDDELRKTNCGSISWILEQLLQPSQKSSLIFQWPSAKQCLKSWVSVLNIILPSSNTPWMKKFVIWEEHECNRGDRESKPGDPLMCQNTPHYSESMLTLNPSIRMSSKCNRNLPMSEILRVTWSLMMFYTQPNSTHSCWVRQNLKRMPPHLG